MHTLGDLAGLNEESLGPAPAAGAASVAAYPSPIRIGDGLASLIEKAQGRDAGGWYDQEVGEGGEPKSISHEHTFNRDQRDPAALASMLARLTEMVCRRLREHQLYARKVQIKLRYSDFTTLTRGRTLERATQLDAEVLEIVRGLFDAHWQKGRAVRLLGVRDQRAGIRQRADGIAAGTMATTMAETQETRRRQAMQAVDALRDRFGESAVSLAGGMSARFRERTHENPAALPGKEPRRENQSPKPSRGE